MAKKKPFLPREDLKLVLWLQNLASKISAYSTKYGITPTEVTFIQQATDYFSFWFTALISLKAFTQKLTAYKNEIRDGVKAGGSPSVTPADILFGLPPTAVSPGILTTILSVVARIKKHQSYTIADGEDLKIEGDEHTVELSSLKPEFKIVLQSGHPNLVWKKGVADAVKIKVHRITASAPPTTTAPPPTTATPVTFDFLAIDTQPDYLDTTPLPAFGQSAIWEYTMIYLIGDEEVGLWSDVLRLTVSGTP